MKVIAVWGSVARLRCDGLIVHVDTATSWIDFSPASSVSAAATEPGPRRGGGERYRSAS
jgi:hypothetical protein